MIIKLQDPLKLTRLGITLWRKSSDFQNRSSYPFLKRVYLIEKNEGFGWFQSSSYTKAQERDFSFSWIIQREHNLQAFEIL